VEALFQQHKGDFDYLLGDWEFTANNKQYGKSNGRWSAVKTATGQILDEYRLVDDKGQTFYLQHQARQARRARFPSWQERSSVRL
jgi:hypothetical protein